MKKKLTLRMDQDAIERAKAYARLRGTSLSKLVEQLFEALGEQERPQEIEFSPLVETLSGIAEEVDVSDEDYLEYLETKHR